MKQGKGFFFLSVATLYFSFSANPVDGCVSLSTAPFSAVSSTEMTVDWVSACSTVTVQYSQVDADPAFLSPVTQITFGPPAVFGATVPLIPNTLYYARVSTSATMVSSVVLGSTPTLAELPGLAAVPFSNISVQGFRVEWASGTSHWNPMDTLYQAELSTSSSFTGQLITGSTTGLHLTFGGLLEGTTYFAHVRAENRAGIPTAFVNLGSTVTSVTPFNTGGSSAAIQSSDGLVTIIVGSGTFEEDYRLFLTTDPVHTPLGPPEIPTLINSAGEKLEGGGEVARTAITNVISEIRAKDTLGNPLTTSGGDPLSVTFVYPTSDGETVTVGGGPVVRAHTLAIYRLSEDKSLWVRLPSSQVDKSARTVTASAPGLGVFSLVGQTDTSLETAYAYPVPFLEKRGDRTITFSDLAQKATLRIFSVSGRWVQTLEETDGDGELVWDVRDADGDPLPSGVYFYLLESSADRKRGKLVIVRGAP